MGWRLRTVECQLENGEKSTACAEDKRPDAYEKCDMGECPQWDFGIWSACEAKCGEGVRRRLVVCRSRPDGKLLLNNACQENLKPADTIKCYGPPCPGWQSGNWSTCDSKTCTMVRSVRCSLPDGVIVTDSNCDRTKKPAYIAECEKKSDCYNEDSTTTRSLIRIKAVKYTSATGKLIYSNWTKCSVNCGTGVQTREASCVTKKDDTLALSMSYCDQSRMEPLQKPCEMVACSYKLVEKWSKCSSDECGKAAVETLERLCFDEIEKIYTNLSKCGVTGDEKPVSRSCYKQCQKEVKTNAVYEWKTRPWQKVGIFQFKN
jgi:hypothetical protein